MAFEDKSGLNVSNHYGPRDSKGTRGVHTTEDGRRQYVIDVEGDQPLHREIYVPKNAIIENISKTQTAAFSVLKVGNVDIKSAVWGTEVKTPLGGNITGTFTGKGRVVITATVEATES